MTATVIPFKATRQTEAERLAQPVVDDLADQIHALSVTIVRLSFNVDADIFQYDDLFAAVDSVDRIDALIMEVEHRFAGEAWIECLWYVLDLRSHLLTIVVDHYRHARDTRRSRSLVANLDAAMVALSCPAQCSELLPSRSTHPLAS